MNTVQPQFSSHFQIRIKRPQADQPQYPGVQSFGYPPQNSASDYHNDLCNSVLEAVSEKTGGAGVMQSMGGRPMEYFTKGCGAYAGDTRTELVAMDEHDELVEREIKAFIKKAKISAETGTTFSYEKLANSSVTSDEAYRDRLGVAKTLGKAEGAINDMAGKLKQLGIPVEDALDMLRDALS